MTTPTGSDDRLRAFGNELVEVHLWLREELDRLRDDVDAYVEDRAGRPRMLRAHCLTFCDAIRRHHTGEDADAFTALLSRFPELGDVVEQLRHDHEAVTGMLGDLESLLARLDTEPAQGERVRDELDGISALLESHFRYEEKRIVAALNALDAPRWRESRPDFLRRDAPVADERP